MLSKKDLNSAELDTVRVSTNTTTIITANGEVQTNEDATVYVYDLDFFVTIQILEDTPEVLPLGKFCEDQRYSYEWTSGQQIQLINNVRKYKCNTENFCECCPRIIDRFYTVRLQIHLLHRYRRTQLMTLRVKSSNNATSKYQQFTTGTPVSRSYRNQKRHRSGTGRLVARFARVVGGLYRKSRR